MPVPLANAERQTPSENVDERPTAGFVYLQKLRLKLDVRTN